MKVYLVIEESCVECMQDTDVKVYSKKEDAIKEWNERRKQWLEVSGWEMTENEYHFEMWEDGYYCHNHVNLDVEESEVQ